VSIFIDPKPCGKVAGTLGLALALALAQSGRVKPRFDHERLNADQASSRIVSWATTLISKLADKVAIEDQFDRASTSVPLNIAADGIDQQLGGTHRRRGWRIFFTPRVRARVKA
jgi:hypothetical protein